LITLGSAPLAYNLFRAAVFEQLGEQRLEAAILSDIAGEEAHAVRMDAEAPETLKGARLYQKTATTVFFESSGGQVHKEATLPEIRLAVGEPGLDIGNVETVLENLVRRCYYLDAKGTAYWISHRPTLNKILADRRAALSGPEADEAIREKVRQTIREVFKPGPALDRRFFPETSGDIPDAPTLTLVVLAPEHGWENASREATQRLVNSMIQEYGGRGRTFKSGLLFAVAEGGAALADEAKTLLALESLEEPTEQELLKLEPSQIQELKDKKRRSERNLKEGVWRAYRRVLLLAEDGIREVDLGLLHPSAAESLVGLIIARLKQEGLVEESISPDFLIRNWPPAITEWSTKALRNMFFASPRFPRLLNPDVLRETISKATAQGIFAYAIKNPDGRLIVVDHPPTQYSVEISENVFILREVPPPALTTLRIDPEMARVRPGERITFRVIGLDQHNRQVELSDVVWSAEGGSIDQEGCFKAGEDEGEFLVNVSASSLNARAVVIVTKAPQPLKSRLSWEGELPPQKWMNFYMKVLTHFATDASLRLRVSFEVAPEAGITQTRLEEIKAALQELRLAVEKLEVK
jgi:hypothetical protein